MTRDFFQSQMQRMIDVYGDRHYPSERLKILWAELQHMTDAEFSSSVSYLIASKPHAPLIEDFQKVQTMKAQGATWQASHYKCSWCNGFGYVYTERENDIGKYAFRCGCDAGSRRALSFPRWEEGFSPEFKRIQT